MIDWIEIQDRILNLVSIKDIINKYTSNKIVRNRTKCICCSGEQANTLSLEKGFAYCFRCNRNFNQIQFVMELQKCDFKTACKMIINDFNLPIEIDKPLTKEQKKEWVRKQKALEKQKLKTKAMNDFAKDVSNKIIDKLRKCEDWQREKRKLPLASKVQIVDNIVKVDFEIERLDWLYYKINNLNRNEDCEYEYTYPSDRIELLREIYKGVIEI